MYTDVYATTIDEKGGHGFERQQEGCVRGLVGEESEWGNDVIIISKR